MTCDVCNVPMRVEFGPSSIVLGGRLETPVTTTCPRCGKTVQAMAEGHLVTPPTFVAVSTEGDLAMPPTFVAVPTEGDVCIAAALFDDLGDDELTCLERRDVAGFVRAFRDRTHVGLVEAKRAWDALNAVLNGKR